MSAKLEDLIQELRARGNRITVPRRGTLTILHEENRHMTCEEIYGCLNKRGIPVDEATVYRTLQWLKQNRVVAQMVPGSGPDLYAILGDHKHHHLVCVECGAVSEIDDDLFQALRAGIRAAHHFVPHIDHYAVYGLCAGCYDRQARGDMAPAASEEHCTGLRGHDHG